ncbi:MAG TPA: LacI family DNA-binding transcriptional regulator [Oleiagrimonas sp.]|nr:LacI family DNA-binding transcriptional regulator [Oleiagrimonas sp.]
MRIATIRDVAKRAGVSLQTVSRVVNHEPSVRPSTRDKVQKAIDELHYTPDLSARNLRSARPHAIGLVYDNPNSHYIISAQNGALAACRETGYGLQIHPCDSASPGLYDNLIDLVRRSRLAGLVLGEPLSDEADLIARLRGHDVQVVRIISATNDPEDGCPCVYVNDRGATYDIIEHLIRLGHQRIGFLWGGREHRASTERFNGYVDALREYGLKRDDALIVEGDYSFDDGFRGARKLLALAERPTAIFGSNDEIAAGALNAARSLRMEVPHDLSIAGFEDSPFSQQSWPSLTTARQATQDMVEHATRLLIAQMGRNRQEPIGNRGFRPELVVRSSTAPPLMRTGTGGARTSVDDTGLPPVTDA